MSGTTPSTGYPASEAPAASALVEPDVLKPPPICADGSGLKHIKQDRPSTTDKAGKTAEPATGLVLPPPTAAAPSGLEPPVSSGAEAPPGRVESCLPFGCAICDRFTTASLDELEAHIDAHRRDLVRHLHMHPVPEAIELASQAWPQGQPQRAGGGLSRSTRWRRPSLLRSSYNVLDSRNSSFKQGGQRLVPTAPIGPPVHWTSEEGRLDVPNRRPAPPTYSTATPEHRVSDHCGAPRFEHSQASDSFVVHLPSEAATETPPIRLPSFHTNFPTRQRAQSLQTLQQPIGQWHYLSHPEPHPLTSSPWLGQDRTEERSSWAAIPERSARAHASHEEQVGPLPVNSDDAPESIVKMEYHEMQPPADLDQFTVDASTTEDSGYSGKTAMGRGYGASDGNNASLPISNKSTPASNSRQMWWSIDRSLVIPSPPSTSRWDSPELKHVHQSWAVEPPPKAVVCQPFHGQCERQEQQRYCLGKQYDLSIRPRVETRQDSAGAVGVAADNLCDAREGPSIQAKKSMNEGPDHATSGAESAVAADIIVCCSTELKKSDNAVTSQRHQGHTQPRASPSEKPVSPVDRHTASSTATTQASKTYIRLGCAKTERPNDLVVVATKSKPAKSLKINCCGSTNAPPKSSEPASAKNSAACAPRRSTRLQARPSRRFGLRASYH